jgi:hypothetical protein
MEDRVKLEAVRIDIREIPIGPMPGHPLSIPRCIVNVLVPKGQLVTEELISICQEQRDRVLSFGKHYCAMAFNFWTDRKKVGKEDAVAVVDYAPGGQWENAIKAEIGDYSGHMFSVMINRTGG